MLQTGLFNKKNYSKSKTYFTCMKELFYKWELFYKRTLFTRSFLFILQVTIFDDNIFLIKVLLALSSIFLFILYKNTIFQVLIQLFS